MFVVWTWAAAVSQGRKLGCFKKGFRFKHSCFYKATMEACLGKKYVLDTTENLDEYLIYIGRTESQRQMAKTIKLEYLLTANGNGTYTYTVSIPVASVDNTFTPGVEFDEKKLDGTTAKSSITIEGNVLTQIQHDGGKTTKTIGEFYPDKLTVTTTCTGLDKAAKWYYALSK